MPQLSIIIPTFNEEKYLPKLLQSIKRQTFFDYEIIVADANSRDRTREIAIQSGVQVVEGGLPSIGRNAGAAAAKGKIFLFLDADVVLPDAEMLNRILTEFRDRKLEIATCLIKPLPRHLIDQVFYAIYNFYTAVIIKLIPHLPGFFILVRRQIHEKIGGFDQDLSFAEDHEYARRAAQIGRFGFLRSAIILVSTRRFDRDGRLSIAAKYLLGELYLLTRGKVPPGSIKYGWGHDDPRSRR